MAVPMGLKRQVVGVNVSRSPRLFIPGGIYLSLARAQLFLNSLLELGFHLAAGADPRDNGSLGAPMPWPTARRWDWPPRLVGRDLMV